MGRLQAPCEHLHVARGQARRSCGSRGSGTRCSRTAREGIQWGHSNAWARSRATAAKSLSARDPAEKQARHRLAQAFATGQRSSRHSLHPATARLAEPWPLQTRKKRQEEVYIEPLARPKQAMARPTCSCMGHWRGRDRQRRGLHAVAWIIGEAETGNGEAETGNGEADMQLHGLHLHGSLARPRPRQTKARPTKALGCKARTGRNGRGRGKRIFRVYGF